MSDDNRSLRLPSGAVAVRAGDDYHFGPVGMVVLTALDVEALFGDSIADDGGRELPALPRSRRLRVKCNRWPLCRFWSGHGQPCSDVPR